MKKRKKCSLLDLQIPAWVCGVSHRSLCPEETRPGRILPCWVPGRWCPSGVTWLHSPGTFPCQGRAVVLAAPWWAVIPSGLCMGAKEWARAGQKQHGNMRELTNTQHFKFIFSNTNWYFLITHSLLSTILLYTSEKAWQSTVHVGKCIVSWRLLTSYRKSNFHFINHLIFFQFQTTWSLVQFLV